MSISPPNVLVISFALIVITLTNGTDVIMADVPNEHNIVELETKVIKSIVVNDDNGDCYFNSIDDSGYCGVPVVIPVIKGE